MKKALIKTKKEFYHFENGKKVDGKNAEMSGDCSNLWGDCSNLRGNCTNLWGDCSGLSGDCSNLRGDCTGLLGNLDDCEITDNERKIGIDIEKLIGGQNDRT